MTQAAKPIYLKTLQGNRGKQAPKQKPSASLPPIENIAAPRELSPAAQERWRRIARPLANARLLSEVDRSALMILCQALVEFDKDPRTSNFNRVLTLCKEFGMTPASRNKIHPVAPVKERDDLFN